MVPTPEEFILDMNVEVESLKLENLFLQSSPPPHYDLSPRRSSAAGTGLDKPGVPLPEIQQTVQERTFLFQAGIDGFCTLMHENPGTGGNFILSSRRRINPKTTTTVQIAAHQELQNCRGAGNSEESYRWNKTSSLTWAGNE